MNTVLILGANGRFGRAAVQAFTHAGWRVLAQTRRAPTRPLPPGAEPLQMPLEDTVGLAWDSAGTKVVVHAVNPPYTRWHRDALPLLRHGLAVAQRLGAHFMLPGNVYNYGSKLPTLLHEDTPQQADHGKARIRVAMEAELQQAAAAGQLRATVIRAGDFYGCGSGSWLDLAVVKDIAKGRLVYPGPLDLLDLPHAWAYLPDLAAAFVAVAAQPCRQPFQTLHFSGHTLTGRELIQGVEEAATSLGLRPAAGFKLGTLPWSVMQVLGLAVPMMRELVRMRYLWMRPHALSGERLAQAAGPLPDTAVAAALRQALLDLGLGQGPLQAQEQASRAAGGAKALSSRRAPA